MSNTMSYQNIKHRAVTVLAILAAAVVLVLFTGCTPGERGFNQPAPRPTIAIEDVDPKDDGQIQAWLEYYQDRDDITDEDIELNKQAVENITRWSMSPQDCRSRIATSIVDEAVKQDFEEDDERVVFAIKWAINEARCWEMKDYDLP